MKVRCIVLGANRQIRFLDGETESETMTVEKKEYVVEPESVFLRKAPIQKEIFAAVGMSLSGILVAIMLTQLGGSTLFVSMIGGGFIMTGIAIMGLAIWKRKTWKPYVILMENEAGALQYMDQLEDWQEKVQMIIEAWEVLPEPDRTPEGFLELVKAQNLYRGFGQSWKTSEIMKKALTDKRVAKFMRPMMDWKVYVIVGLVFAIVILAGAIVALSGVIQ